MYNIKLPATSKCKQCSATLSRECISSVCFQSTVTGVAFFVRVDVLDRMVLGSSSSIVRLGARLLNTIPVDLFDDTNGDCLFHLRFRSRRGVHRK